MTQRDQDSQLTLPAVMSHIAGGDLHLLGGAVDFWRSGVATAHSVDCA